MTAAIVDTGPLIAFFDRAERYHRWVVDRFEELDAPLLVCEPVLAEAMYLLARYPRAQDAVLELIQNGALSVAFRLDDSRRMSEPMPTILPLSMYSIGQYAASVATVIFLVRMIRSNVVSAEATLTVSAMTLTSAEAINSVRRRA